MRNVAPEWKMPKQLRAKRGGGCTNTFPASFLDPSRGGQSLHGAGSKGRRTGKDEREKSRRDTPSPLLLYMQTWHGMEASNSRYRRPILLSAA